MNLLPWRRWAKFPVWYYNLEVSRNAEQVARELRAILSIKPAVLGVCEAVGYRLPAFPGYRLVRDISRPGRANVAAYVATAYPIRHIRWTDLEQTWERPKHPGIHPARSVLTMLVAGVQVTVHHQPPRFTNNEIRSQEEGNDALIEIMAPWTRATWNAKTQAQREHGRQRPRLTVEDANRTARDGGPSPAVVARAVKGRVTPETRIDCAITTGQIKVDNWAIVGIVAGVRLQSDHKHALQLDTRVPREWLTTTKEET